MVVTLSSENLIEIVFSIFFTPKLMILFSCRAQKSFGFVVLDFSSDPKEIVIVNFSPFFFLKQTYCAAGASV